jgi:YtoQ family protein
VEDKVLHIYLSGEIHTDWRQQIEESALALDIPVLFSSPELNHEKSDQCGDKILGAEQSSFWKDHKAAKLNSLRQQTLLGDVDLMIIRFGEQYKQWNAAFDAGQAAASGIPYITLHDEQFDHALKEVDAQAQAVARDPNQVIRILQYITGK